MAGRDLGGITAEIDSIHGKMLDRVKLIARDQTNKATNAMTKARYEELGIEKAVWQHNAGGKTFRESHVKMDGEVFVLADGMYDPDEETNIQPGELPFCRCSYRPYLPEFGSVGKAEEAAA
jgi:SPP1 gp7 family putative phage head morphogenesis protein